MGTNRESIDMQIGVVNFKREYQPLPIGTKILVMPQLSYMPDQILGKKWKAQFSGQNLTFMGLPFQNVKTYSTILYDRTSLLKD